MDKYNINEVVKCYDLTANEYSKQFINELDSKQLDKDLLYRFSKNVIINGLVIDQATGSGHIAAYLTSLGLSNVIGTDLSEKSIILAKQVFPNTKYEIDNMLESKFENNTIAGITCFYGIVHFTYSEIDRVLSEWMRILKTNGVGLFSFHIGNESLRVTNFLNIEGACATWNLFEVDEIIKLMDKNNISYDDIIIRYPYIGNEHPTKRCYIQFTKK